MQHLKTLIDKAADKCGGSAALARRMGVSPALITLMRKGQRAVTPQIAAELADIAGDDARQAVIDAVIEGSRGTRKEGAMREILGKALAAGVAGLLVFSYSEGSISGTDRPAIAKTASRLIANQFANVYIVSSNQKLHELRLQLQPTLAAQPSVDIGTSTWGAPIAGSPWS